MIAHAAEADLYYEVSGAGPQTLVLVNGVGDPVVNDADRTPSPNRFCSRFGMRNAARNASATPEFPK